jgi:hypothetical protein
MSNLSATIKSIQDVMRQDAGFGCRMAVAGIMGDMEAE